MIPLAPRRSPARWPGSATSGRRSRGRAPLLLAGAATLVATGCAAPGAEDEPVSDRRTELAATPEPLDPGESGDADGAPSDAATSPGSTPTASPTGDEPEDPPTAGDAAPAGTTDEPSPTSASPSPDGDISPRPESSPSPTFERLASTSDPPGDLGVPGGPDYADLVEVTLAGDGRDARVTVRMAGDIPPRLDDGEVMGVGVDLWRGAADGESDYQLFADGGSDGWFAFLQTPDGFVEYPGEFRLGGARLVFEVPWAALGGIPGGHYATFVDWSRERPALNDASSDAAPDEGATAFTR